MKEKWKFLYFPTFVSHLPTRSSSHLTPTIFHSSISLHVALISQLACHYRSLFVHSFSTSSDDCEVSRAISFFISSPIASVVIPARILHPYPITTNVIKYLINKTFRDIQIWIPLILLLFFSREYKSRVVENLKGMRSGGIVIAHRQTSSYFQLFWLACQDVQTDASRTVQASIFHKSFTSLASSTVWISKMFECNFSHILRVISIVCR